MPVPPAPDAHACVDRRRARLAGAAWMLTGASCIGIVDGIAKYLSPTLNGVQIVWGYVGASLLCLLVVSVARSESPFPLARPRRPWLQIARGALLVCSLSALFVSLRYLPLAVATSPLAAEVVMEIDDLVYQDGGWSQSELRKRGYSLADSDRHHGSEVQYWWSGGTNTCARVE